MKPISAMVAFAATIAFALPASAQVTGGQIALSHSGFFDDTSVNKTALDGALEFGINRNFSVQGDLGFASFNATSTDVTTATVHGIFHQSPSTSIGAFYGVDRSSGSSVDLLGLEFGTQAASTGIEG